MAFHAVGYKPAGTVLIQAEAQNQITVPPVEIKTNGRATQFRSLLTIAAVHCNL